MEKTLVISFTIEELQTIITNCVSNCLSEKNKQERIDETIYDTKDIAKMFKVSTKTISNWREDRLIGYSKINNRIFYRQSHIEKMLERHSVKPLR